MSSLTLKVGDRVVLQSGGAPMTVTAVNGGGWLKSDTINLAAMSPGGLLQVLEGVPAVAVKKYAGADTPNSTNRKKGY